MAFATRCPHCHQRFRVTQAQLHQYQGQVRCGHCQQVFSGVDHLEADEHSLATALSRTDAGAVTSQELQTHLTLRKRRTWGLQPDLPWSLHRKIIVALLSFSLLLYGSWWQRETLLRWLPASDVLLAPWARGLGYATALPASHGAVITASRLHRLDEQRLQAEVRIANRSTRPVHWPMLAIDMLDQQQNIVASQRVSPKHMQRLSPLLAKETPERLLPRQEAELRFVVVLKPIEDAGGNHKTLPAMGYRLTLGDAH